MNSNLGWPAPPEPAAEHRRLGWVDLADDGGVSRETESADTEADTAPGSVLTAVREDDDRSDVPAGGDSEPGLPAESTSDDDSSSVGAILRSAGAEVPDHDVEFTVAIPSATGESEAGMPVPDDVSSVTSLAEPGTATSEIAGPGADERDEPTRSWGNPEVAGVTSSLGTGVDWSWTSTVPESNLVEDDALAAEAADQIVDDATGGSDTEDGSGTPETSTSVAASIGAADIDSVFGFAASGESIPSGVPNGESSDSPVENDVDEMSEVVDSPHGSTDSTAGDRGVDSSGTDRAVDLVLHQLSTTEAETDSTPGVDGSGNAADVAGAAAEEVDAEEAVEESHGEDAGEGLSTNLATEDLATDSAGDLATDEDESASLEDAVDDEAVVAVNAERRGQLIGDPFPRPVRSRVMTVANQKGGVGKTTTTVNVGAALAQAGLKVLVIDLDPQGNASTALGIDHHAEVPSIYDVLVDGTSLREVTQPCTTVEGLWCAPATIDLAGAEIELVSLVARESRLKRAIDAAAKEGHEYDYILIDCPPSLGLLTINAMVAADEVFIPIQAEYYALEGLSQLLKNIDLVQAHLNPDLHVSTILLTMYDGRTRLSAQVADEVREHFPEESLLTMVPRSVRVSEAPSFGETVMTYDPTSSGALAYLEASKEIAERGAAGRI